MLGNTVLLLAISGGKLYFKPGKIACQYIRFYAEGVLEFTSPANQIR